MGKHHRHYLGVMSGWDVWALMYMFTSDTVFPIDKWEFFWRMAIGPLNFLGV